VNPEALNTALPRLRRDCHVSGGIVIVAIVLLAEELNCLIYFVFYFFAIKMSNDCTAKHLGFRIDADVDFETDYWLEHTIKFLISNRISNAKVRILLYWELGIRNW